jgi:hypothetical protein
LHPGSAYPVAGSPVYGIGTSKQFTQTYSQAKKLRLHPIRLDDADKSADRVFWKAYPNLDTVSHSGEEMLMIPLTFAIFPDFSKPDEINIVVEGDYEQFEE